MCQHQHKSGFLIMLTCHLVSINSITKENHSWNFQASQKGLRGLTSVKRNIKQIQLVPLQHCVYTVSVMKMTITITTTPTITMAMRVTNVDQDFNQFPFS